MIIQKKVQNIIGICLMTLFIFSCKTEKKLNKDFNYFQKGLDSIRQVAYIEPKLAINDLISIQVIAGSVRQEDAAIFNLTGSSASQTGGQLSGSSYQIDIEGNVELPKIGKIQASGLTKLELAEVVRKKIADEVKNPLVIVKLSQFKINVLGEVKKPGVVIFKTDKVSVLDAIAEAGDLSESGKRDDVLVMRQIGSKYETYKINLTNTDFINGPAYYLQQNDLIYVSADRLKLIKLTEQENKNNLQIILAVISTLSLLVNTIYIIRRG
jgi:polysaccharide export outer membrane protein